MFIIKILVAYYSHSGNTRQIAEIIQKAVGGTLFEIEPKAAYPVAYNTVVEQAKKEIKARMRPALKLLPDVSEYDAVIIGTPNWWSTAAPPVMTFLEGRDLSSKQVTFFCTHGGGGQGHIFKDMSAACPDSKMLKGIEFYGDGGRSAQAMVSDWLRQINLLN
ncbi:flavodoxin [Papillibacter cinnamivorans]|uniref:flavodoxin n=1 Tax=Papillibacter cinnamivorans TaxID=100176 RepID=UPI001FA8E7BF|nr:flavodoxin [Papillibacter cinnamivorans]